MLGARSWAGEAGGLARLGRTKEPAGAQLAIGGGYPVEAAEVTPAENVKEMRMEGDKKRE